MSNQYTTANNYDSPVQGYNMDLIGKAIEMKQTMINQGRQNLDDAYASTLASIDVMRDVDKDYADKRIAMVTDVVNRYANQDLSNPSLVRALKQDVGNIVDDNIKTAITSTATIRAESAAWAKLKEDDPEKYSDLNKGYAQQGANAYLATNDIGRGYGGGGGVIHYTDVQAKLRKELPEYLKQFGVENVTTREGIDGLPLFYDQVTGEEVTQDKVKNAMRVMLNDTDKQQLGINSWGQFQGASDEDIATAYEGYKTEKVTEYNESIAEIEQYVKDMGSSITGKNKAYFAGRLKTLNADKQTFANKEFNRETDTYNMYYDGFEQSFMSAYSYNRETERKTQDHLLKSKEFANSQQKHNLDMEKGILQLAKLEQELQAAKGIGGGIGTSGTGNGGLSDRLESDVAEAEFDNDAAYVEIQTQYADAGNALLGTELARDLGISTSDPKEVTDKQWKLLGGALEGVSLVEGEYSAEDFKTIRNFKSKQTAKRKITKQEGDYSNNVVTELSNTIKHADDNIMSEISGLSKLDFYVEEGADGKFKAIANTEGADVFSHLVAKKRSGAKLNKAEQRTYQLNLLHHAMTSSDITDNKQHATRSLRNQYNAIVGKLSGGDDYHKKTIYGASAELAWEEDGLMFMAGQSMDITDSWKAQWNALKSYAPQDNFLGRTDFTVDGKLWDVNNLKGKAKAINTNIANSSEDLLRQTHSKKIVFNYEELNKNQKTKLRSKLAGVDKVLEDKALKEAVVSYGLNSVTKEEEIRVDYSIEGVKQPTLTVANGDGNTALIQGVDLMQSDNFFVNHREPLAPAELDFSMNPKFGKGEKYVDAFKTRAYDSDIIPTEIANAVAEVEYLMETDNYSDAFSLVNTNLESDGFDARVKGKLDNKEKGVFDGLMDEYKQGDLKFKWEKKNEGYRGRVYGGDLLGEEGYLTDVFLYDDMGVTPDQFHNIINTQAIDFRDRMVVNAYQQVVTQERKNKL